MVNHRPHDRDEPSAAGAVTRIEGLETHHLRRGEGEPVLILHGWGASTGAVMSIVNGLAAGHEVHALDLPGFGGTAPPPGAWGVADYQHFTLAFMDAVGLKRCSVIGHSFGGRIAIRIAAEDPERIDKLVLVNSAGIRPRHGLRYYRRVALAKLGKLGARVLGGPGRRLQRRLRQRTASSDYLASGELRPTFARVVGEDLRHLLPRIEAPTLLIWGSEDAETPPSDGALMRKLIPDAGLVVLEGAGHYSYADQPARFARIVDHLLDASK